VKGKETEDLTATTRWTTPTRTATTWWNEGETEQWTFDAGLGDNLCPGTTVWHHGARPVWDRSQQKTQDYGRQIF